MLIQKFEEEKQVIFQIGIQWHDQTISKICFFLLFSIEELGLLIQISYAALSLLSIVESIDSRKINRLPTCRYTQW